MMESKISFLITKYFRVVTALSSTINEGIWLDGDRMIVESTVTEKGTENGLTEIDPDGTGGIWKYGLVTVPVIGTDTDEADLDTTYN